MSESLFSDLTELDVNFLESAYGDDAETAAAVFEDYLKELPTNLQNLKESIQNRDIQRFAHLLHKQKPAFSYVGLTDVTTTFQELQAKCSKTEDLDLYKPEIDRVIARIESTSPLLQKTLDRLRQA